MAAPAKINYTIYQGSTFKEVYRWESTFKIYKPITNITKTAPIVITSPNNEIVNGWRFKVTGVLGMKQINCVDDTYYYVTDTNGDDITVNSINATNYTAYAGGGLLEYNKPFNLNGYAAKMQIRSKVDSDIVLLELTTENGGISIDTNYHTITITISADKTSLLNFNTAVYSLELINGDEVISFISGILTLIKEVTR